MKKVMRDNQGFSILEVVVVLAVLGALAAMLSPVVFRYIDDANRARAAQDTKTIATAIQQMYSDTGRWAFYKAGNGATAYTSGTDAALLFSSANSCASNAVVPTHADTPTDSGTSWALVTATKCDTLANQLVTNKPFGLGTGAAAYVTTGPRAWKGSYTETLPSVDSWGHSYIVNIGNAGGSTAWVVAISAGADGILQTDSAALFSANPSVPSTSDDIIARVK